MASKTARPGRRLIIFGVVVAALYGGVALGGAWKPKLGLDLQGGTRITLEATHRQRSEADRGEPRGGPRDHRPARQRHRRRRVRGRHPGRPTTSSSRSPGRTAKNLVNTVKQTAQLRFRLVAAVGSGQPQPPAASPEPARLGDPERRPPPSAVRQAPEQRAADRQGLAERQPRRAARCPGAWWPRTRRRRRKSASPSREGVTPRRRPAPSRRAPRRRRRQPQTTKKGAPVDEPLAWRTTRAPSGCRSSRRSPAPPARRPSAPVNDDKSQPLVTCDEDGNKLLLSAPLIEGTQLKSAQATASRRTRSSGSST